MSTSWRFEVGGIYEHHQSHRRVVILAEGECQRLSSYPSRYRHVSAYPITDDDQNALDVYLDWNYPPECATAWILVGRVAANPRVSDEP